ncbi:MAG: GAF domain-containing protein, partial [Armatimonadota bacterium]|nr:GAF domain-containing protein [Armatimonadota bacterium]
MSDPAQKRIQEVSAIYEISQAINTVSIDELLKLITEKAAAVMDAQACSLMLKDPNKDELVIKASYGLPEEIVKETRVAFGEGVAGRVALTGEPMLLTNLQDDPRFTNADIVTRPEIASSICVPLKDENSNILGVLSIRRISPAEMFTEEDVKLFSVFASQAALAISNSHLYTSLKDRVQELSVLHEASKELSSAYNPENAANALIRLASQIFGGLSSMLLLHDRRYGIRVQAASNVSAKMQKAVIEAIDDACVAWMHSLHEPRSFLTKNKSRCPASLYPLLEALKRSFARIIAIPLVAEGSVIGLLLVCCRKEKSIEKQRIRLLSIIASQAATIIKNVTRYKEQIEQKVLELTVLYQLSERISTAANLKEALNSILDIVRDIVWYDQGYISTVDYEKQTITLQAWKGINVGPNDIEIPLVNAPLSSWTINERKAIVLPDVSKDSRFNKPSIFSGTIRSLMCIPLIVQDEVVGVLNICSHAPNLYTEENVRILSIIASQAAALYKELETSSALASYTDNILRSIAAGVITIDSEGRVLTWNKAAEEIVKIPVVEAIGRHFTEIVNKIGISEADKKRTLAIIENVLRSGQGYLGHKLEYHPTEGDSDIVYINMNITQLRDHTGEVLGLVLIFEDVTREIEMENEMRRISELAAVGQLAATIAHELRNPLSSIKGAAQFLRKEYEDHSAIKEFLDIIIDEVNVLSKITTEFLDFARPTKLNLREMDINDVVFRTLQFMQLEMTKQNVQVHQVFAYDLPRILADDKQLEQVLRNIFLNALQAMPEGGSLYVSTGPCDGAVRITITDTGTGIPEDKIDKIFVPFFTTKTKGTGLGLSIVQKIVENHGGTIRVQSKVGEGTTFEIRLPVSSDRARILSIQADTITQREEAELLRRSQRYKNS